MYLFGVLTGFTTKTRRHEGDTKEMDVLAIHPVPSCAFVPLCLGGSAAFSNATVDAICGGWSHDEESSPGGR